MIEQDKASALTGRDEYGRSVAHKISPFTWIGVSVTAGIKARVVPSEFWAADVTDDGVEIAVVACPCGHSPQVPVLELVACDCQRFYFHGSAEVWSLNVPSPSNESPPETP